MLKKHQISGLMDHLKINKAFIASQCSNDIEDFCSEYHNKILGLSIVVPITINSKKFSELDQKIMVLKSEFGVTANSVNTLKNEINNLEIIQLNNYEALAWSDICEDKSSETCEALISFFKGLNIENYSVNINNQEGQFENISYKVIGEGPPLLLFPFFLSAKQWNPIIQKLSDFFTLVIIGGKDFGAIPSLEDRAELPTYKAMLETLVSNMNISKNGKVLELGCGPASLCRQVLKLRKDLSLVGVDINEYLLTEGSKIAQDQNFKVNPFFKDNSQPSRLNLKPNELNLSYSDATNISFPDNFFDAVYSVTVLEECDAQKSIAEIKRVLKPGGKYCCLEFSAPKSSLISSSYKIYKSKILPLLGEVIAKDRNAYKYLSESIDLFPSQEELSKNLLDSGFTNVETINLFNGIVAIHTGYKL